MSSEKTVGANPFGKESHRLSFRADVVGSLLLPPSIHEAGDKWQKGSLSLAVLGLVTTKTPQFEKKDDLRRRIDEATKFAPLAQLALSPQCGFTSIILGNRVTHDEQRRKLELVVETARDAWGE